MRPDPRPPEHPLESSFAEELRAVRPDLVPAFRRALMAFVLKRCRSPADARNPHRTVPGPTVRRLLTQRRPVTSRSNLEHCRIEWNR